jgi:3-methyladenine DNA glycosylase AlkD
MPSTRTTKKPAPKTAAKTAGSRSSLAETMRELEKAGSAQTRKTYARHGALEPMFGVSFATLKTMVKRIGVDHDLALELWDTGNHDARTLAIKIADPARMKASDLDRWASGNRLGMCGGYVAMLAAESPHGPAKARQWLSGSDVARRTVAWLLAGHLAQTDAGASDAWFAELIERIESTISDQPDAERAAMNQALIQIGGRSPALRKAATAAAKRIGKVEVDHGDTACKTPDAATYIEKMWAHAAAKKFASPAAQERARESMRTRC